MSKLDGFDGLGVSRGLQEKLKEMNITVPTPVQRVTIPAVFEGKNLVVQSPTGTGKTLAYLAPLLMKVDRDSKDLEVLILVPSRELAIQVVKLAKELADDLKVAAVIGGTNQARQREALKDKPKIAVGTPGRVLELLKERKINGQAIKTIVVDEADKMLSGRFAGEIKAVFKATLKSRQVLMFSATIPREMQTEIPVMTEEPEFIILKEDGRVPAAIRHLYIMCGREQRTPVLVKLLGYFKPHKTLIFIERNEGVGPLAGRLQELGFMASALHSDLPQALRKEVLRKFRAGKDNALVTTDLMARGMDIADVDYIFNYDLPQNEEFYLHRAGRTGRAGKPGIVVSLVEEERKFIIGKYSRYLRVSFEQIGLDMNNQVFAMFGGINNYYVGWFLSSWGLPCSCLCCRACYS